MKELTNTIKMEIALQECLKLFKRIKKRSIDRKNYDKAAKIREYEKICKDALYSKNDDEFFSIIVSKAGASVVVSADDLISRLGLLEMADHNIHEMINDVINHYKIKKETP